MILQKEILKEAGALFSTCLGALLAILLVGRILRLKDLLMGQGGSLTDIALLFVYLCPFLLSLLLPVVCMLSIFLTFLRMGADREIIALRASGVSMLRLLPGPLFFCLLIAGAAFFNSAYGISWGMQNFRQTVFDMAKTKTRLALQPGVFNQDFPGVTIYAKSVGQEGQVLQDVFVQSRYEGQSVIVAPKGEVITDEQRGQLLFTLYNGFLYHQGQKQDLTVMGFESYALRLDLSRWLSQEELEGKRIDFMSLPTLWKMYIHPQGLDDEQRLEVDIEVHKRIALPVACLILGCFALPLALVFQGLKRQYGLILALLLFMLYYGLFSTSLSLGEAGTLPPAIGLWLPNLVFFILFFIFMLFMSKGRQVQFFTRFIHFFSTRKKEASS